jgi:A/G-specific adenine glycosylase
MLPEFHAALEDWFTSHGRSGLPWRDHPSPYAVLVSEFMLQQTTVAAVIPKFNAWMTRFPDILALAAAPEADVMKQWEGLGYYSRARNLHSAAKAIVTRHGGSIPKDPSTLRALPGIGSYTASAIAAFAFDSCVPVLDANIIRLTARLANFQHPVNTAKGRTAIEQIATTLLPATGGRDHTSALMDLGSTICYAGVPDCPACPLSRFCKATSPAAIPIKPARKKPTEVVEKRSIACTPAGVHLMQSPGPRWKGLWVLPPCTDPETSPLITITHAITRYKVCLELHPSPPDPQWTAFPPSQLPAMPSPHRKALTLALEKIGMSSSLPSLPVAT